MVFPSLGRILEDDLHVGKRKMPPYLPPRTKALGTSQGSLMFLLFENERPVPDIEVQPSVDLQHWRIVVRSNGDLHLTAQLDSGSFRVTSKLECMEPAQATVRTESGRRYRLCAPPEEEGMRQGLMQWRAVNDLDVITGDVSEVVWQAIASGAWPAGMEPLLPRPQ